MRLVFAGTPEFARRALSALIAAGHRIDLVLTQPDRPAGRGLRESESAVKRCALDHGLDVLQPATVRDAAVIERVAGVKPDALVVAAFGMIFPPSLLDVAPFGALNIHASLLPRWRGAAPLQRALLAGDTETGITIMKMDAGLDTGPMLGQRAIPIEADDDAGTLHERLASLGGEMIVAALDALQSGRAELRPQPAQGATYARKIDKSETVIDWNRPAHELERAVRAFRPSPGARARLRGQGIKIWRAKVAPRGAEPGVVVHASPEAIVVGCGRDALAVTELQRAGGRRLGAADFLRGTPLQPGERFENGTP